MNLKNQKKRDWEDRELVRAGKDFWENLREEDRERVSAGKRWVNEK